MCGGDYSRDSTEWVIKALIQFAYDDARVRQKDCLVRRFCVYPYQLESGYEGALQIIGAWVKCKLQQFH